MSLQRSVQQQNAVTKAEIERAAALQPSSLAWLGTVLLSHKLEPASGILVRLCEVPEQEGNLMSSVWLTDTVEFWEFEAMISRTNGALIGVEGFKNATPSFPLEAGVPGTGASFGNLARQVLRETRNA
ncbi:MAG: hypothetical protein ABIR76_15255 [Polaromonas sp.]